ncbi:conjugal transfer protein TraH [Amycolatopsis mediterranei]|uniref:conjugal transfer protein TraH n=1 Tax=Amycolatopsis mediterranei TaxID=33910 RepID=UPI00085261D7|nr:conjugal transfer protein TraH [Amycolatopsis mediterranei]
MRELNDTPPAAAPRRRTRTDVAVAWTSAHAIELTGVGAPLVAGQIWSPWLDLISAVLAGVWAANEIRLHRRTRPARQIAVTTTPPARQLSSTASSAPAPAAGTDRREAKA